MSEVVVLVGGPRDGLELEVDTLSWLWRILCTEEDIATYWQIEKEAAIDRQIVYGLYRPQMYKGLPSRDDKGRIRYSWQGWITE